MFGRRQKYWRPRYIVWQMMVIGNSCLDYFLEGVANNWRKMSPYKLSYHDLEAKK